MKKAFVIFLSIVLLFGAVSIAVPATAPTAAAASSSSGGFVGGFAEKLQQAIRSFFNWLLSLFRKAPSPAPEIEVDEPTALPPTQPDVPTSATQTTTESTAICDSEPSSGSTTTTGEAQTLPDMETLVFQPSWEYASFSAIHTDSVKLYHSKATPRKNKTVCVNAGHGTKGGDQQFTLCHPDGSAKVTGGSTAAGATQATAVSGGTTFLDGTPEAEATLSLALLVKEKLLAAGYDVLMIREDDDAQLDNIARTVFANNCADCHIALHYDSSTTDKGLFYCGVPNVASYRNMEPVKSHFEAHTALGEALLQGARAESIKIYSSGRVNIDLTQTSYSTVPSVDLEVGDRASDHGATQQGKIADGIVRGVNAFFG
ncbi:MAG: N-acetylmuramoyl-L-alanine amidase [Clostridia bacterium]|nr:N-acetylmuramoyl-L-alanine amidase [Clostridia bacterium]